MALRPRIACVVMLLLSVGCGSRSGLPELPPGRQTDFRISGPQEIATPTWIPPGAADDLLPDNLRLVSLREFAEHGPDEFREYLAAHPEHGEHAVSFLEIIRQREFSVDGRALRLGNRGATLLWNAPVKPKMEMPGSPRSDDYLILLLALPDPAYVDYMLEKGHHADLGSVQLTYRGGTYRGSAELRDLRIEVTCVPSKDLPSGGSGRQRFFSPGRRQDKVLVISYAGHQLKQCNGSWTLSGTHPLAASVPSEFAILATGFRVRGGIYATDSR